MMVKLMFVVLTALLTACCGSKKTVKMHGDNSNLDASSIMPVEQEVVDQTTILFDFDKNDLTEQAKLMLDQQINYIKNNIYDKSKRLVIEGHCDTRGSHEYNMGLGSRRAASVKEYMYSQGIDLDIEIVSYGKTRPVDNGTDEYAHSKNRRAVADLK